MNKVLQKTAFYIILLAVALAVIYPSITTNKANASTKSGYIVIEESTDRVLYENNAHAKLPMASTTKIVTALVVLEHAKLDEEVVVPKIAEGVEGSSIYIKAGHTYTVEDLLYGLMLRSGNDSAVALAVHVAGSVDAFCALMNEKARMIGANNTNFTNPHGLHDDNHYTTAYDLAILTSNAYKNEDFRRIVSSKKYNLQGQMIFNKNKMLSTYEGADGVKTGYTKKSGRCLVSSSKRGDMRVICVVLNCYDMWNKNMELMSTAHESYKMTEILSPEKTYETQVDNGILDKVPSSVKEAVKYPLKAGEIEKITYKLNAKPLKAPIYQNQNSGNIEVYLDNHLIFNQNIYTISNVRKKSFWDWLHELTTSQN